MIAAGKAETRHVYCCLDGFSRKASHIVTYCTLKIVYQIRWFINLNNGLGDISLAFYARLEEGKLDIPTQFEFFMARYHKKVESFFLSADEIISEIPFSSSFLVWKLYSAFFHKWISIEDFEFILIRYKFEIFVTCTTVDLGLEIEEKENIQISYIWLAEDIQASFYRFLGSFFNKNVEEMINIDYILIRKTSDFSIGKRFHFLIEMRDEIENDGGFCYMLK